MAGNIDGITRAPARSPKRAPASRRRIPVHTVRATKTRKRRNIPASQKLTPITPSASPQRASTEERRSLMYVLVGVALIGVVGLWALGFSRTLQSPNDDGFFSSIIQQVKEVFTGSRDDFSDIKNQIDNLGKDEVERLEGEVFPDLPNLNE